MRGSVQKRGEAWANRYLSVTCFCCIVLLCLLDFVCIHSACMLGVLISNNIRRQTACNSGHVCCFWFQRVYSGLHIIHMQRHTCSPILRGPVVLSRLFNARGTLICRSRGLQKRFLGSAFPRTCHSFVRCFCVVKRITPGGPVDIAGYELSNGEVKLRSAIGWCESMTYRAGICAAMKSRDA